MKKKATSVRDVPAALFGSRKRLW